MTIPMVALAMAIGVAPLTPTAHRHSGINWLTAMKTSDWDDPSIRAIGRRYAAEAYDLLLGAPPGRR